MQPSNKAFKCSEEDLDIIKKEKFYIDGTILRHQKSKGYCTFETGWIDIDKRYISPESNWIIIPINKSIPSEKYFLDTALYFVKVFESVDYDNKAIINITEDVKQEKIMIEIDDNSIRDYLLNQPKDIITVRLLWEFVIKEQWYRFGDKEKSSTNIRMRVCHLRTLDDENDIRINVSI